MTRPPRGDDDDAALLRSILGLLLMAVAGWVDAVSFLRLNGVFASFMSGTTTQLGVDLPAQGWAQAGGAAGMIGLFFAGAVLGSLVAKLGGRWGAVAVLCFDAVVLCAAVLLSAPGRLETVGTPLLAVAMGAQNAATQQVGSVRIGNTYVTGTLFNAGHALADLMLGRGNVRVLASHLLSWLSLLIGVGFGAWTYARYGVAVLWIPVAMVLLAAAGLALITSRESGETA